MPIGEGRGSTELTALLFRRSGFCSSARRWLERGTALGNTVRGIANA